MNKILDLINQKKLTYEQELLSCIKDLRSMQKKIKDNPEKSFEVSMKEYPSIQARTVGAKMVIKALMELRKEVEDMNRLEV